jgi:hypothetical protein
VSFRAVAMKGEGGRCMVLATAGVMPSCCCNTVAKPPSTPTKNVGGHLALPLRRGTRFPKYCSLSTILFRTPGSLQRLRIDGASLVAALSLAGPPTSEPLGCNIRTWSAAFRPPLPLREFCRRRPRCSLKISQATVHLTPSRHRYAARSQQ